MHVSKCFQNVYMFVSFHTHLQVGSNTGTKLNFATAIAYWHTRLKVFPLHDVMGQLTIQCFYYVQHYIEFYVGLNMVFASFLTT